MLNIAVPPEKDKTVQEDTRTDQNLPEGIQAIFAPEEEDDTSKLQDLSSPLPSPVSKEEILQMAVESIIDIVHSTPIMAPGSPQRIVEEYVAPAPPLSSSATTTSLNVAPRASPITESLSTSLNHVSSASAPPSIAFLSENSPPTVLLSTVPPTTNVAVFELTKPPFRTARFPVVSPFSSEDPSASLQVGAVQPMSHQPDQVQPSHKMRLDDFRPSELSSPYVPAHESASNSFHNLISDVFLHNLPCAQKGLLQAMALSLEGRNISVLHGIELPPDPGLLPTDPLHMGTYLYVAALFDEFEDYLSAALKDKTDIQQLLVKEKERIQQCHDQLQNLREVNSLLAKSNSPAEKEQIIRLQQDCRKASQNLQEVTQDYQELKALSERLRMQLDIAQAQRTSASLEAQASLDRLQVSTQELSDLKVKMISMVDSKLHSPDHTQLKSQLDKLSLELQEKQEKLNLQDSTAKDTESKYNSLQKEADHLRSQSVCLEKAEEEIKSLRSTKVELAVQVKDLSKERDNTANFLADAKVRSKSNQAEMESMQAEKKSLLQNVAAKDERISSLKVSLDNLTKDKKKSSSETAQELEKAKNMIDKLHLDKSKLLKQIKDDGVNFFRLKDNTEKKEKMYEESLKLSNDQVQNLKEEATELAALKSSLETVVTTSENKILDLEEELKSISDKTKGEKSKSYQKLKKKHAQLVQFLQEPSSAGDSSSNADSDFEDADSQPQLSKPPSPLPADNSNPSPHQEPLKTEPPVQLYSAVTKHGAPPSQSSQDENFEISVKPEDCFPPEPLGRKRERSPTKSSSPGSRKKSRSGSSERNVRYENSPPRQQHRTTQLHYDLDVMEETYHTQAYDLISEYTRKSIGLISQDKSLIRYLRGSASTYNKLEKVQVLLKGYAKCASLDDLSALHQGQPPPSANSHQPLPNLSPDSDEWMFIQNTIKKKFVHFPSIMALYRLYCTKLYAFFHFGKYSEPFKRQETISLLHTADRDNDNTKRSDYEKKIDLLLVLIIGRLVFYHLDKIDSFRCNPDNLLHLPALFLSEDFMEQMISARTYQDPYLLPRKALYHLYTDCYGSRAKRDFNFRITRYEPSPLRYSQENNIQTNKSSQFSWMDQ